jgi:hypothetical protein
VSRLGGLLENAEGVLLQQKVPVDLSREIVGHRIHLPSETFT